ncbi:MAG: DUF86 domain-containing protein [Prolixibacteraceae bacterium]|nr:DUF86 domain-containing protein [Prolixibacteraceae bacterium]
MKDETIYIDHILLSIRNILSYTQGVSKDEFSKNTLIQDAVIRNIEIIGEATKKISDDLKLINHEIPWKEIAGMRDKLIHDYIGVDIEVIWNTILFDIPALEKMIKNI